MSDRDSTGPGGLHADDLPEPTGSLAEFYRAIDGTSRGRKRQYHSLDEIPGDERDSTQHPDDDEDAVADPPTVGQVLAAFQGAQEAAAVAVEDWNSMDEQTRLVAWDYLDEHAREGLLTAFRLHDDPRAAFAELHAAADPDATEDAADDGLADGDQL